MKTKAVSLKIMMVMGLMGWSLSGFAQAYQVDRNRVFFDREPMPYADARTFVDLGYGYAKDRDNVYLDGRILEFVDPATFRLKGRDGSHVRKHRGDHERSAAHSGYYKTKFNVYYGDKKIDAVPTSFKEIGGGYAKDAFNVFYEGMKVEGASASTFKYTGDGYAEDAFNAFYRGRKLE